MDIIWKKKIEIKNLWNFVDIRLQASRKLAGKSDPSKAAKEALQRELEEAAAKDAEAEEVVEEKKEDGVMRIFFDPPHYTVMENIGTFDVTIVREGGDLSLPVQVDYKTEDGKHYCIFKIITSL